MKNEILDKINSIPVPDVINDYNAGILEGIAKCRRIVLKIKMIEIDKAVKAYDIGNFNGTFVEYLIRKNYKLVKK